MTAYVCSMTGWTWDYVRNNMTFPRLAALQRQWAQHPPTHVLVAGFMGYKAPADTPESIPAKEEENNLDELIRLFGQAGGIVKQA